MTSVLGLDGCKGGWVGALVAPDGAISWHFLPDVRAALALAVDVIAIDIPIGLPESGGRQCDRLARARLGPRGPSVFPAPVRAVLAARTYAEARLLSVSAHGVSLSAQCFAIVPKIRDADEALRPADNRRVVEVHPEVSFRALAGRDLARKKSAGGALARMQVLQARFPAIPEDVPEQAALDDALDALVCAWTAQRWARGAAEVLGDELDALGTPMRIAV